MNKLMNGLKDNDNFALTANGALAHKTTKSDIYDMFALGAAFRNRSDEDVKTMVANAVAENESLAMKCLFYIRDIRGGQGERRFFRVAINYLASAKPDIIRRNMEQISEYGRYDDYYALVGTPLEKEMFSFLKLLFVMDQECNTPSLLMKWLKSENASSKETRKLAIKTRDAFGLTSKEYRKALSAGRTKINIVEKLMSENRWEEIEFDKIPSKAGLKYKNAFARRDIIAKKYETFATDENTKVNAGTLYPYEIVNKALENCSSWNRSPLKETDRAMINKYWENQKDYLNGVDASMLAVIDTSGSMTCGGNSTRPIDVAISLGLYMAERVTGPFANQYISFASRPQLIETKGSDFVDKVKRIYETNLVDNTNLAAVFDLLLNTAKRVGATAEDMPKTICIISDMQIDQGVRFQSGRAWGCDVNRLVSTEMETIRKIWEQNEYELPHLIYWNVNASNNTILDGGPNVSYVSGCSPSIFESVLTGKMGYELMLEKLLSERYTPIQ